MWIVVFIVVVCCVLKLRLVSERLGGSVLSCCSMSFLLNSVGSELMW